MSASSSNQAPFMPIHLSGGGGARRFRQPYNCPASSRQQLPVSNNTASRVVLEAIPVPPLEGGMSVKVEAESRRPNLIAMTLQGSAAMRAEADCWGAVR